MRFQADMTYRSARRNSTWAIAESTVRSMVKLLFKENGTRNKRCNSNSNSKCNSNNKRYKATKARLTDETDIDPLNLQQTSKKQSVSTTTSRNTKRTKNPKHTQVKKEQQSSKAVNVNIDKLKRDEICQLLEATSLKKINQMKTKNVCTNVNTNVSINVNTNASIKIDKSTVSRRNKNNNNICKNAHVQSTQNKIISSSTSSVTSDSSNSSSSSNNSISPTVNNNNHTKKVCDV